MNKGPLTTTNERFWSKVNKTSDCWIWLAGRLPEDKGGYAKFYDHKTKLAHRVSWELAHGPIPHDKAVLHKCPNHACVRPDHLYLASVDVARQTASARRQATGEGTKMPITIDPRRMAAVRLFGANMRVLRIKKLWTVRDLANATGCNRHTLGQLEDGLVYSSDVTLDRIAQALGSTRRKMMSTKMELPDPLPAGVIRCPYGCGTVLIEGHGRGGHMGHCDRNPARRQLGFILPAEPAAPDPAPAPEPHLDTAPVSVPIDTAQPEPAQQAEPPAPAAEPQPPCEGKKCKRTSTGLCIRCLKPHCDKHRVQSGVFRGLCFKCVGEVDLSDDGDRWGEPVRPAPTPPLSTLTPLPAELRPEVAAVLAEAAATLAPPPSGPITGGLLPTPTIDPGPPEPKSDPFAPGTPAYVALLRFGAGVIGLDETARQLRAALRI